MPREVEKTEEVIEELLDRVARGEFLRKICKDERMPTETLLRKWRLEDDQLNRAVDLAKKEGAHYLLEDSIAVLEDVQINSENARYSNALVQKASKLSEAKRKAAGVINSHLSERWRGELSGKDGTPLSIEIKKYSSSRGKRKKLEG